MYSGYDYEEYCCEYLRKKGYKHIQLTPRAGDHGIDIIAVKRRKKYAFQCKYYEGKVGNRAVQEAYTGCSFYECDIPVVMTNSEFTKNAVMEAERLGVELIEGVEIRRKTHFILRLFVAALIALAIIQLFSQDETVHIFEIISGLFGE